MPRLLRRCAEGVSGTSRIPGQPARACLHDRFFSFLRSLRSSRSSANGSSPGGWPPTMARSRSSSALNSAPRRRGLPLYEVSEVRRKVWSVLAFRTALALPSLLK